MSHLGMGAFKIGQLLGVEEVARRFLAAVPARHRSRLATRLLEQELKDRDNSVAAVCRAADRDKALRQEIYDWRAFEDGIEE